MKGNIAIERPHSEGETHPMTHQETEDKSNENVQKKMSFPGGKDLSLVKGISFAPGNNPGKGHKDQKLGKKHMTRV